MKLILHCVLFVLMCFQAMADSIRCKDVTCPEPAPCPEDSDLKKINKHFSPGHFPHHYRSNIGEIVRRERAVAGSVSQRGSIAIVSSTDHHKRKRSISDEEDLIQHCCPRYECICNPNYCKQICPEKTNFTNPTEQNESLLGVPGNCCPQCKHDYCMRGTYRRNGDKWREDECTTCECHHGEAKCHQTLCKTPECINHKWIPGECCPVCNNEGENFCPKVQSCLIHCKYGYKKQGDCNLCECDRMLQYDTTTETNSKVLEDNTYSILTWYISGFVILAILIIISFIIWCRFCHQSAQYSTVRSESA